MNKFYCSRLKYILLTTLLSTSHMGFSQIAVENDCPGEYILIKDSIVRLSLWLGYTGYGMYTSETFVNSIPKLTYPELPRGSDIVAPEFDYEGNTIRSKDQIKFDFKGEKLFTAIQLDSFRLIISNSIDPGCINDTLYRIRSFCDCRRGNCVTWIYTFYLDLGKNPIAFSDIEDTLHVPVKPMLTYQRCKERQVEQCYDLNYIHPLSTKFYSKVKY